MLSTFSIVAIDRATSEIGIAVQSKFPASAQSCPGSPPTPERVRRKLGPTRVPVRRELHVRSDFARRLPQPSSWRHPSCAYAPSMEIRPCGSDLFPSAGS